MLILAGVSINLVLGENGLITQAKEAKRKTEEVQNSEEKGLNNAANYIKQNVGITSAEITAIDYGKAVTNYNMGEKTWEIFFADNSNIYLITRENCGQKTLTDVSSEYNGTIDFDGSEKFKMKFPAVQAGWLNKVYEPSENGKGTIKYSSSYENMKVTEYLLDSSIWNQKYLDTEKGDWVIGASTLELLVESYNKKNENNKVEIGEVQEFGYDNPLKEQDILGNIDRTEEKEQELKYL